MNFFMKEEVLMFKYNNKEYEASNNFEIISSYLIDPENEVTQNVLFYDLNDESRKIDFIVFLDKFINYRNEHDFSFINNEIDTFFRSL